MGAKPDLDDGFLMLAHELDAALAVADFTKGARVVLREVFAQIYGISKRKTAAISPSEIADRVGMAREQLSRGVKELIDARVLTKTTSGDFCFIKDYECWLYRGEPRLSKQEAEYCRLSAPKKGQKPVQACDSLVTGGVTESSQVCDSLVTPPVTESSRTEPSPYRNAGAEFNKQEERTTQERGEVLKFGLPKEEAIPEYPEGDGGMYDITPSTYPMEEGRARQIFRMIWKGWADSRFCFQFYQRQQFFPEDIWIAAIRNVKLRDVAIGSLSYIERVAADYLANGIPKPKAAPVGARPSSPASVPLKPLHPPGTVIPSKYLNPPRRIGSA